jgi:hypothetical protein
LINGADRNLRWFVEDVWGQFDADHARPGAPLFPSERKCGDGSCSRATADVFRRSLAEAAARHLPAWESKLTPHGRPRPRRMGPAGGDESRAEEQQGPAVAIGPEPHHGIACQSHQLS